MISSLDHLIVAVKDLQEAELNYKKVFGIEPVWRGQHKELGTANSIFNFNNTYFEPLAAKGKGLGASLVENAIEEIVESYSKNNLDDLDLNLDLRIRVGENLPWYAAILGGLPAIAGSAVINEIFEEDINNLTNYQYEVLGTISEPKLKRVKQEIQ